jgi:hypothetical protein
MANYVGVRYTASRPPYESTREVFEHDGPLQHDSMRPTYDLVVGPFRTKSGATYLAKHWFEPQCCNAEEAESLSLLNNVGVTIAGMLLQFTFLVVAVMVVLEGSGGLVSTGWYGRGVYALLAAVLARAMWRDKIALEQS